MSGGTVAASGAVDTVRELRAAARRRRRLALAVLSGVVLVAFVGEVTLRPYPVPLPDVVRILTGTTVPGASFVLLEDTLPRAVTGLLVGAALGLSGTIFQSLYANPLASPDVLGVSAGAGTAAVLAISLGAEPGTVSLAALTGALTVGLGLQALSRRDRSSQARLVLVGIGAAAALSATTSYLLTRTDLRTASQSVLWLTGSLGSSSWDRIAVLAPALALLVPPALLLARVLRGLEAGEDTAAALGVPVAPARTALLLVAVALTGVATATAGPVSYIAFLAGPLARRLLGGAVSLPASAAVGAALVLGADWLAAHLVPGTVLPVGVVTGALGAPFLLILLARGRAGRGA